MYQNINLFGIDEAGRGPIAGPLVVSCVSLKKPIKNAIDSKFLSYQKRKELVKIIKHEALFYAIHIIDNEIIDSIGLTKALDIGIFEVTKNIPSTNTLTIFDGSYTPKNSSIVPVIKGDAFINCIAAASILAKQTRDDLMIKFSHTYKEYEFALHKGYPSLRHRQLLKEFGPCKLHRKSFKTVKNVLNTIKSS